jgi:predicted phage terminase large subunit-like protein
MIPMMAPVLQAQPDMAAKFFRQLGESLTTETPDLHEFIRQAWDVIEPSTPFVDGWHVGAIEEHLTAVDEGQIQLLDINMPPRNGKSILVSVIWPVYSWISKPFLRWIFSSYSGSLSTKHSIDRRDLVRSPWFRQRWGAMVTLAADQDQKTEYKNSAQGTMIATSVGGTITGKGGNRIVMDDMINPEMAESKAERESAIRFYRRTLRTRLDNKKMGSIINVAQRLHSADLSSVLKAEGGWTRLVLPAQAPKRMVINFPISCRQVVRKEGDVLCPEREPKEVLERQKAAMGTRIYSAQYQQEPIAADSGYFHTSWWKFYKPAALPTVLRSCRGWDTAVKTGQENDSTCGCLIHQCENGYYLNEHFFKNKIQYPELKKRIILEAAARPADYEVIEDASAGASVIQDLQSSSSLPILAFQSVKDKVTRASVVSPLVEAGKVFLPEGAPWVADFIDTMASFPEVEHDDDVDAFVIALMQLSGKANSGGAGLTVIGNEDANDEDR